MLELKLEAETVYFWIENNYELWNVFLKEVHVRISLIRDTHREYHVSHNKGCLFGRRSYKIREGDACQVSCHTAEKSAMVHTIIESFVMAQPRG